MRTAVIVFSALLLASFVLIGYELTHENTAFGKLTQMAKDEYSNFLGAKKSTINDETTESRSEKISQIQPEPVDSLQLINVDPSTEKSGSHHKMPYFLERSFKRLSGVEGKLETEVTQEEEPEKKTHIPYFLERSYKRLAAKEKADEEYPIPDPFIYDDTVFVGGSSLAFDDIDFQPISPPIEYPTFDQSFIPKGVQIDIEISDTKKNTNFLKKAVKNFIIMNDNMLNPLNPEIMDNIYNDNTITPPDAVLAATIDFLDQMLSMPLIQQDHSKKHKKNHKKEKKNNKKNGKANKKNQHKKNKGNKNDDEASFSTSSTSTSTSSETLSTRSQDYETSVKTFDEVDPSVLSTVKNSISNNDIAIANDM